MLKELFTQKPDKQQKSALAVTTVMFVGLVCVLGMFFLPGWEYVLNAKRLVVYAVMLGAFIIPFGLYFGYVRKVDTLTLVFVLIAVGAAVAARTGFFDFMSTDYTGYLAHWVHELKITPGISRWRQELGDYNMPYIYFLTVVAKQPLTPLYIIKIFSCLFDFVLAFYMMKISSLWFKNIKKEIAVFILVLFFPTAVINSAFWAQCDAIYTAFAAAGLYYCVTERKYLGIALFAVAFSFKLQTVFILPVIAVLLIARRIELKHLLAFPATLLTMLLPALLAGKPIKDTLMIYVKQTENYPRLSMNTPNIYALLGSDSSFKMFSTLGLFAAGAVVAALIYLAWINRKHLDSRDICVFAFLFVITMPFFLPRMHERYFFMSDVFSLTVFFADRRRWYVPFIAVFASFRSCVAFILAMKADVNFAYLSVAVFIIIAISVYDLVKRMSAKKSELKNSKGGNACEALFYQF